VPEVVRLGVDDVKALRELLRACWLDTYAGILPDPLIRAATEGWHSRENLMRGVSNPSAYYGGYFEEGALRGMVSAAMVDSTTLKIFQLYVHPAHQRRGVGWKLMGAAVEHFEKAESATLEVEEKNPKGVAFYKKYGFHYPRRTMVKMGEYDIPCLVGEMRLTRHHNTQPEAR
jgi:ribosomal protein S18 acetylase RimI-like enzyme